MDITPEIAERAARIRLLIMDCDGVLTDGRLYYSGDGESHKAFHVHDGQGIVLWHSAGSNSAVVTARRSQILEKRAGELGIRHLIQGAEKKEIEVKNLCDETGIGFQETAYVGDDIADLGAMKLVGLPIAVSNARPEVRAASAVTTSKSGGEGAIREVVDMLLSARSGAA